MESSYEDCKLVSIYISGDENALSILIERHKDRLYSFIFSKINNREVSDEIFQDTFIRAIQALKGGKYNHRGKFLSWLMKISHNLIYDYFKSRYTMIHDDTLDTTLEDEDSSHSIYGDQESLRNNQENLLKTLVENLSPDLKNIVKMRLFEGLSFKQIVDKEGISINTATGRMRYALQNIRKEIKNKGYSFTL